MLHHFKDERRGGGKKHPPESRKIGLSLDSATFLWVFGMFQLPHLKKVWAKWPQKTLLALKFYFSILSEFEST